MSSSEEVLELSVEETNKLRAELGLAPLRVNGSHHQPAASTSNDNDNNANDGGDEVLEMSVDETNALRAKLGLKPLTTSSNKVVHQPAQNLGAAQKAAERIEAAKLQRQVQEGITQTFGHATLVEKEAGSGLDSWASKMRKQKTTRKKNKKKAKEEQTETKKSTYDDKDLEGLEVAHNVGDLQAGSTTVLTLADSSLLETDASSHKAVGLREGDVALENATLADQQKQQDGLRKKRLLELGMGRAGGYAGFDDEEFEELGGTLGPSRNERGNPLLRGDDENEANKRKGFRIGKMEQDETNPASDFDKIQQGKAISLVPMKADVAASDYMTMEEEAAERAKLRKKKDGKFKKSSKKKKKDKKKNRHTRVVYSDDEDGDDDQDEKMGGTSAPNKTTNILEQLEATADPESTSGLRKRRRDNEEDGDEMPSSGLSKRNEGSLTENRAKYEQAVAKGNERTRLAFAEKTKPKQEMDALDEEPDDSFLNAALAKARRLNRLREMNGGKATKKTGAEAVAEAVRSGNAADNVDSSIEGKSNGTIMFSVDETREFTLALRAREQQKEREAEKAKLARQSKDAAGNIKKESQEATKKEPIVETAEDEDDDVDMEELAKEVKTDDTDTPDFEIAEKAGVGRGLSSFVSMLKTTGEIKEKQRKEELRGRAKDERNYDNYEALDLSKVVKIGRNATDKDKEFANREIKLEYRDKHGRLLTEKEAWRDLCTQFHGHGSGKKKEEKRLRQIAREQAEARMASRQIAAARDGSTAGTLGALRATQKATAKAFVVHKTS